MLMKHHPSASCPDCGEFLLFGTNEEATGWKVYYECNGRCGFERMAGWVKVSEIEHRDKVHERAREIGEQWADRNEQE